MADPIAEVTTPTVPALISNFLEHGRYLRGWSPRTVQCYGQALATFTPDRITKQTLQQFVLDLQARGHNPGGINLIQRALNSFLTWAHEQGHTDEHHKVRLIRVPKTVITPISTVEMRRLIAFKPRGRAMRRAHMLVMLLLDTGLRITEALTLERSRVDLERRCVTVSGKGSQERVVPISVQGRKALFLWLSRSKGRYVFCTRNGGSRLTYRNAYRDMKSVCEKVSVTGSHVHPHALRHAFAVNYIRSGGDVYRLSRILGHSSIQTTSLYLRSMGFESLQEGHRSPLSAA